MGTLDDIVFQDGHQWCTIAPSRGMLKIRHGVSGFKQHRTAVILIGSLQVAFWYFLVPA